MRIVTVRILFAKNYNQRNFFFFKILCILFVSISKNLLTTLLHVSAKLVNLRGNKFLAKINKLRRFLWKSYIFYFSLLSKLLGFYLRLKYNIFVNKQLLRRNVNKFVFFADAFITEHQTVRLQIDRWKSDFTEKLESSQRFWDFLTARFEN